MEFLKSLRTADLTAVLGPTREPELPLTVFRRDVLAKRNNFPLQPGTVVDIEAVRVDGHKNKTRKYLDRKPLEHPVLVSLVSTSGSFAFLVPTSEIRDREGAGTDVAETNAEELRKEEMQLAHRVLENEGFAEEAASDSIQSLRLTVGVA